MAERSIFWATTNAGDGPSSGYSSTDLFEAFRALFTSASGTSYGGVAPDYLNMLAVSGATSPVSVNTGAGLAYGIPYFNSASVTVAIPTPVGATRVDRIVLRASWAAQTVRVTRIAGVEGGAAPNITQSPGVTWDVKLAQVSITTGGAITVTDERQWIGGVGDGTLATAKLAASAVTTAKVADANITTAKLADSSVTTAKIAVGNVTSDRIANNAVTGDKILDANVTTSKVADANITTAKLADSSVTTAKIAVGNVTTDRIANNAITGDKILDGEVSYSKLASNAVTTVKVADDAVTNAKLANMTDATVKGRALGAGTGDVTDLSATQVLGIVNSVAGAGSGLNADMVDGKHATSFSTAPTAWANMTLSNAATIYQQVDPPQYRLNNDVVEFRGVFTYQGTSATTRVWTPPAGYTCDGNYSWWFIEPRGGAVKFQVSSTGIYVAGGTAGGVYDVGVIRYTAYPS